MRETDNVVVPEGFEAPTKVPNSSLAAGLGCAGAAIGVNEGATAGEGEGAEKLPRRSTVGACGVAGLAWWW